MASLDADVVRRGPDRRDRHHRPLADAGAAERRRRATIRSSTPIVHEGSTTTLIPSVLSGQLHAAIVHLPIDDPELVIAPLFAEDLLVHRPRRPPVRRPLVDVARRPRRHSRCCCRPRARRCAGCSTGRRRPPGSRCAPRPRSTASGCSPRSRSTATGRRSCRPPPCPQRFEGAFRRIAVPELPQRVVAWVRRRRPAPSSRGPGGRARCSPTSSSAAPPTSQACTVAADAFPLGRSV